MGAVLGIIAEYNPFHLGHAYHLAQAKAAAAPELTVACLSGPFVQRGEAALFSPAARAEMALSAGCDLVVELPALFACREAEYFALGGVSLLKALGCTHLAFGAECPSLPLLREAQAVLAHEPAPYAQDLKIGLSQGLSFAAAQGRALEKALGQSFNAPNNALALCYLKALKAHPMTPLLIPRQGNYHSPQGPRPGELPSATAVRQAILRRDWALVESCCPPETFPLICREARARRLCPPNALDQVLGLRLMEASPDALAALPGMSEGLDIRLRRLAAAYTTREALLAALKTKRYTYTRLSRLLCHALLGLTADSCRAHPLPPYARILGFNQRGRAYLNRIKKMGPPLLTKAARWNPADPVFQLDMRAYDLWALGAGQPLGMGYCQGPVTQ